MNRATDEKRAGAIWGSFIGDALAMPVHWYCDREALCRDYGRVSDYVGPRNPHPDSILWRSTYTPLNERGDILHEQAQYWGQRGIHYHQFLRAGENALNLQLGRVLMESLLARGGYHAEDYLAWKYADDFEAGVLANTNLGGDNCHRGAVVGALLGAAVGTGQIPARLCDGLHLASTLQQPIHQFSQ